MWGAGRFGSVRTESYQDACWLSCIPCPPSPRTYTTAAGMCYSPRGAVGRSGREGKEEGDESGWVSRVTCWISSRSAPSQSCHNSLCGSLGPSRYATTGAAQEECAPGRAGAPPRGIWLHNGHMQGRCMRRGRGSHAASKPTHLPMSCSDSEVSSCSPRSTSADPTVGIAGKCPGGFRRGRREVR